MAQEAIRVVLILTISGALGFLTNQAAGHPPPWRPHAVLSYPPKAPRWTTAELQEALAKDASSVLILDAREASAWPKGHPKNAIQAPVDRLLEDYSRRGLDSLIRAAKHCIVLCESGDCPVADRLADLLHKFGHDHVRVLEGGWRAYVVSGLPVEEGP